MNDTFYCYRCQGRYASNAKWITVQDLHRKDIRPSEYVQTGTVKAGDCPTCLKPPRLTRYPEPGRV